MRKVILIGICFIGFIIGLSAQSTNCPDKIKWKKLKTEQEVYEVANKCISIKSSRTEVEAFLKKHKMVYSDINGQMVYASIKGKSKSVWIEKKWLFEIKFDSNDQVVELLVKEGLTGP